MKRIIIVSAFLIATLLTSCAFLYENEVRKRKYEEKIYEELWKNGDFHFYKWDMNIDSLLVLRQKYKPLLKPTRKGLDYLVYKYRHHTGRWGTQEFRFLDKKLYKVVAQWKKRGKFGITKIASSLLSTEPDFKSENLLNLNSGLEGESGIFECLEYPPHRILCRWSLKKYTLEILVEKNIEKEDSYNYYEITTKPESEHKIESSDILKRKIINIPLFWGVKMDSVKKYQKSISFSKPKYTSYDKLVYPYKKIGNLKGEIEFRFTNNQLTTIIEKCPELNEKDIELLSTKELMPYFCNGISEIELSKLKFDDIFLKNKMQKQYSWDFEFINYRIILKKNLANPKPLNVIKNITYKINQEGKIVSYDLYKVYTIRK